MLCLWTLSYLSRCYYLLTLLTVPKKHKGVKGFTLLELMIVVIIIGILSAIAIPSYVATVDKFKYGQAKTQMDCLKKEIIAYRYENGDYPAEVENGIPSWSECFQTKDIPFGSSYDYNNLDLGDGSCYIGIVFWGKDQQADSLSPVIEFQAERMGFRMSEDGRKDDLIFSLKTDNDGCGESGSGGFVP